MTISHSGVYKIEHSLCSNVYKIEQFPGTRDWYATRPHSLGVP
jgi:hypothetical protein